MAPGADNVMEFFKKKSIVPTPSINLAVFDILDGQFYGTESQICFAERLSLLSKKNHSNNKSIRSKISVRTLQSRQISSLLFVMRNFISVEQRSLILKEIQKLFAELDGLSLGDIFLMREVGLNGGRIGMMDKLISQIDSNQEETPLNIGNENWEDIMTMISNYEGDPNSIYFDFSIMKIEKDQAKDFIRNLMTKKEINAKEVIQCTEVLISLGRIDLLDSQFNMYKYIMDSRGKRCALRIKSIYNEYEIFHLVLYYFITDFNRSLKKAANCLTDCLIMCVHQLNNQNYLMERNPNRIKEEYDKHEEYVHKKGINFSIFFKNSYLYYNIYKFLSHCNILNLSDVFLKCSIHEIFRELDSMSDDELLEISIQELTIMNRILVSMNVGNDLSQHIESYLLLKIGDNEFDQIQLFMTIMQFNNQDQIMRHLINVSAFCKNKLDKKNLKKETNDSLVARYVCQVLEGGCDENYLSFHPKFAQFFKESDPGKEKAFKLDDFFGQSFPTNSCSFQKDPEMDKLAKEYFKLYVIPNIRKQIEALQSDLNKFDLDLLDSATLKKLKDDFEKETSKINDFSNNILDDIDADSSKDEFILRHAESSANLQFFKNLQQDEEKLNPKLYTLFIQQIKQRPSLNIFSKQDILIPQGEGYDTPDYLKLEGIKCINCYFLANQQKITKIIVEVHTKSHLMQIIDNLHMMTVYSPYFINFLGLIFDFNESTLTLELEFVCSPFGLKAFEYFSRLKSAQKDITFEFYIKIVQKLVYAIDSLINCGIPPPILSPEFILISCRENPQILIPWFSQTYLCQRKYYTEHILKFPEANVSSSFIPHFYQSLPEPYVIEHHISKTKSYSLTGLRFNQEIWESILKTTYYCLSLTIQFFFTLMTLSNANGEKQIKQTEEYLVKLSDPKFYEKSQAALAKQFKKTASNNSSKLFVNSVVELIQPESRFRVSREFNPAGQKVSLSSPGNPAPLYHNLENMIETQYGLKNLDTIPNDLEQNFEGYSQKNAGKKHHHFILTEVPPDLSSLLHIISSSFNLKYHPFDMNEYNQEIVEQNEILRFNNDAGKSKLKQNVFLSNSLTFNGYLNILHKQNSKYYFKNDLVLNQEIEVGNNNFTSEVFIDDSRSLLLDILNGRLSNAKLMVKGGNQEAEKRVIVDRFYNNTWMAQGDKLRSFLRKFLNQNMNDSTNQSNMRLTVLVEEINMKTNVKIPASIVNSLSYTTRSEKNLLLVISAICSFIHVFDQSLMFEQILFYDPFGNIIFENSKRNFTRPFYYSSYGFRSISPHRITETYIYKPSCTSRMYLWSNLSSVTLSRTQNPISSHYEFVSLLTKNSKNFSVITYFDELQYWGASNRDNMIEGNLYTNYQDFSTISNKHIFKGQYSSSTKNFLYKGFFQGGLPHHFGAFYLFKRKVYCGFVRNGIPQGKGEVYYQNGELLFQGYFEKGIPVDGVHFDLPRVYVGLFQIKNKASYKFSFRRLNLMVKSLDYESMLQKFALRGKIYNSQKGIGVFQGQLFSDAVGSHGVFQVLSSSKNAYYGSLENSKKRGLGLLTRSNGMKLIGYWGKGFFIGSIRLSSDNKLKLNDALTAKELDSTSQYQEVRKIVSFNQIPLEVRGKFKVQGKSLILHQAGIIIFKDGSIFEGMIKENMMHGYGKMAYKDGETYRGMWKCNQINGIGEFKSQHVKYRGMFNKGLWHGFGILELKEQKIKGQWKNGLLIQVILSEFQQTSGILQKAKATFFNKHSGQSQGDEFAKIQIIGPAEISFDTVSSASLMHTERRSSNTQPNYLHHGSATQAQSISESQKTAIQSQKTSQYPSSLKNLKFFGEFVRFSTSLDNLFYMGSINDKKKVVSSQENETSNCIASYGVLTNGQSTIFTGLVDVNFENFLGLKFDPETDCYTFGHFNKELQLESYGVRTDGIDEYHANFKSGILDGLVIWHEFRVRKGLGYWKNGLRHGLQFFFEASEHETKLTQDGASEKNLTQHKRKKSKLDGRLYNMGIVTTYYNSISSFNTVDEGGKN